MKKSIFAIALILFVFNFAQAQVNTKVVYSSNKSTNSFSQIFVMDADGSNKKQLTELENNCYYPRFSPNGRSIVFYTDKEDIYYIRDYDSVDTYPLKYIFSGIYPMFSPGEEYIVFDSEFEGALSIYYIEIDGLDPDIISSGSYSNQQVFSGDGLKIVYSSFSDDGSKCIYYVDFGDTNEIEVEQISKNKNSNLEPDVNYDGSIITYASFDNNLKGTIYMNIDRKETTITKGASWNQPRLSPDESKVACIKITDDEKTKLYVMDLDGSNKKELSIKGGNVGTFRWVDSERIIYDAENGTTSVVGIIDITTDKPTLLASDGINIQPDITK
jgi:Tol biopolymer transport system component